ncbi:MAG: S8 family serine peptidase [Chloroflexota bacterium]|nr:S8 family serine peptidase [Chloroflexota bacterium]
MVDRYGPPSRGDGWPASIDRVIGVTSTDPPDPRGNEEPSVFSDDNPHVDAGAPGSDIVIAFPEADDPYDLWSGTSMATPWVAGAAALLLEQNRNWTPAQVKDRLESTTKKPIAVGVGAGRLDVVGAVGCGARRLRLT